MDGNAKKKILLGICDIGNGHVSRQKCIIEELAKCNVEIVLAVTANSMPYFNSVFPDLKKVLIRIPWIFCNNVGVDFNKTLIKYKKDKKDQFKSFLQFASVVQKCFEGEVPDFIISDYEPNVAQFAYSMNIPLICMEQQSKFLFLDNVPIDGITINEEIARLSYFFPKVDYRYISSFFPIEMTDKLHATIIPPILKKLSRKENDKSKVVVYFSPYSSDIRQFLHVLNMLKRRSDYKFVIYSKCNFKSYQNCENFIFKKFGEEFNEDISDCSFIISSSGHQLISEAISLEIPLLIYSFSTYEQRYNAKMVEKYGLGKRIEKFEETEFSDFLEYLECYRENMKHFKDKYWKGSWNEILMSELRKRYGIYYIQPER